MTLYEVNLSGAKAGKSIYASYVIPGFSNNKKTLIYYRCTYQETDRHYCSKGESTTVYTRYDGENFTISQGLWAFDALVFNTESYSSSTYPIIIGKDRNDKPIYADTISVSDRSQYLKEEACIGASNDSVYINLNTRTIDLYATDLGGDKGTVNINFGSSGEYRSQYVEPVAFPATSSTKSDTKTRYVDNYFQRFHAVLTDMKTGTTYEADASHDLSSYILKHFTDKKNKTFRLALTFIKEQLNPGRYLLSIYVYEDTYRRTDTATYANNKTSGSYKKSKENIGTPTLFKSGTDPIWTETIAFNVYGGQTTYINGRSGFGGHAINAPNGIINVGGEESDIESIQESTVTGNYTYVINPNNQDDDTYILNNTDVDPENGSRIEIAEGVTDFTIDLNGTDVKTEVEEDHEDTTILTLKEEHTVTIVNNGTEPAIIGGVTNEGTGPEAQELFATFEVNGGTLNVTGTDDAPIIISGPSQNEGYYGREGAINFSGNGGTINISGNVAVGDKIADLDADHSGTETIVKGITSFLYPDPTSKNEQTTLDTSTTVRKEVNINISDGASINVSGDSDESSYGIYLVGDNSLTEDDVVNITLDAAHIVVDTHNSEGFGIYIKDMGKATINVTLKNGSGITVDYGSGIVFDNCDGTISLTIDNSYVGNNSATSSTAIGFNDCDGNNYITLQNNAVIKTTFGNKQWRSPAKYGVAFGECDGREYISVSSGCQIEASTNSFYSTQKGGLFNTQRNNSNMYINGSTSGTATNNTGRTTTLTSNLDSSL